MSVASFRLHVNHIPTSHSGSEPTLLALSPLSVPLDMAGLVHVPAKPDPTQPNASQEEIGITCVFSKLLCNLNKTQVMHTELIRPTQNQSSK